MVKWGTFGLVLGVMSLSSVQAETLYLRSSGDASGKSSMIADEGGAYWASSPSASSGAAPVAGNDYVIWVDPATPKSLGMRTPAKGYDYTFPGDTLTLESYLDESTAYWASIILKHKSSKTATFKDMTLKNGRISISDSYKNVGTMAIAGQITIPEGCRGYFGTSGTESDDRRLSIKSSFVGGGDIVFDMAGAGTTIGLNGSLEELTGRLYFDHDGVFNTGNGGGGTVNINANTCWPANPTELDESGVVVNNGAILNFQCQNQTVQTGTNRGFDIRNKAATIQMRVDCTVIMDGPIKSDKGFNKKGNGTLVLKGDNSGLADTATVNATAGTLVLAHPKALGSAALTLADTALTLDVTQGAIELSAVPTVSALTVKASSVAEVTNIPLMRLPAGSVFDATQVAVTYDLPETVDPKALKVLSAADEDGVLVYLGVPAANLPTVTAMFKSVASTSATYTLELGYAGACTDPLVVTAYYGETDCGTNAEAWDHSFTFEAVEPGTSDFTVPGLEAEQAYQLAFKVVSVNGGEAVWTAAMSISTASIAATAPASVFESDPRGVTVTFTRPASVAANALTLALGYTGDTTAFDPETLVEAAEFAVGATSTTVTLKPLDNKTEDAARAITVSVQAGTEYVVGAASLVTVDVLDDESYEPVTCVWSGSGATLAWTDPTNWQDGRVPMLLDEAVLGENVTQNGELEIGGDIAVKTLSIPATASFTLKAAQDGGSLTFETLSRPEGSVGTLDLRVPVSLMGTDGTNRWDLADGTTLRIYDTLSKAQDPLVVLKTGAGRVEMRKDGQTYNGPWVIRAGTVRAYGTNSFAGKSYIGGDETLEAHLEQDAKPAFGSSINPVVYAKGSIYANGVDNGRVETTTVYAGGKVDYRGNIYCKEQIYHGGEVVGGGTFYLNYGQKTTTYASDVTAKLDCTLKVAGGTGYGYNFNIEDGEAPIDFLMTKPARDGQSDNNVAKNGAGTMKTTANWGDLKNHVKINAGTWLVDNPGEYGLGMQTTTVAKGATLGGTGCVGQKDVKATNTVTLTGGTETEYATCAPGTIDVESGAHVYGTLKLGREAAHNPVGFGAYAHLVAGLGAPVRDEETGLFASPNDRLLVYGKLTLGENCVLDLAANSATDPKAVKSGTYTVVEADEIVGTFKSVVLPQNASWRVAYVKDADETVTAVTVTVSNGFAIIVR